MKSKKVNLRATGNGTEQAIPVAYHIVPNGKRWDVEKGDTFTGQFAYDMYTAIGLATASAKRDQHNGEDVSMVCVEQSDGSCQQVWP